MSDKRKAFISILTYSLLSGAMAAVTKVGLSQIPPFSFAFIRFLFATLIITPFIWNKRTFIMRDFKTLGPFSILAALNIIFFILGIGLTTANISQILYAVIPIIVGLLTHFVLGEKLSPRKIMGIAVGFVGTFLILFLPILEKGGKFSGDLTGNILLLIAVVCFSGYMMLSKKAQRAHSSLHIVSVFIILTTILLSPFFIFESISRFGWWREVNIDSVFSMSYVVLAGTIITYLLNQYSIKHGGTIFASMAFYLSPLFGFLVAFILLGEQLTAGLIAGGALALLGVYLFSATIKR